MNKIIIPRLMFKIKDAGLFLGVLYLISFLIILPFYLKNSGYILTGAELALISIIAIVIVQVFLNWLYVLIIYIPTIMAAIIGVSGLIVYVFSPLLIMPADAIISTITALIGGSTYSSSLSYINDFLGRLGQGLMIIAGSIWWLVQKGKDINYKALAGYLIGLAGLGVVAGISSFSGLLLFLTIWAAVYLKVQGNENLPDLQVIFKIVATSVTLRFKQDNLLSALI